MNHHRTALRLAAGVAVLALLAAACSSSKKSSSAATATTAASASGSGASGSTATTSASSGPNKASATGITATSISIGSHQPLTGVAAPGYDEIAPAAKAYFSWVNDHGGIYGRKITVEHEPGREMRLLILRPVAAPRELEQVTQELVALLLGAAVDVGDGTHHQTLGGNWIEGPEFWFHRPSNPSDGREFWSSASNPQPAGTLPQAAGAARQHWQAAEYHPKGRGSPTDGPLTTIAQPDAMAISQTWSEPMPVTGEAATNLALPSGIWTIDPAHSKVGFAIKHMTLRTLTADFTTSRAPSI